MTTPTLTSSKIGIAIAAPSGCALDDAALARGVSRLEQLGFLVHNYYHADRAMQRFSDSDAGRLGQLHEAASDPAVQIVLALRGGYGISRILSGIDFEAMAASGKLFVGYSDFTAFHMGLMAGTGAASFAGPMMCDDFNREEPVDFTLRQFWDCLRGPTHRIDALAAGNPSVAVDGKLWGGNLAMLVNLLGTPYFPDIDGGILFVEDIAEHPFRVERMLLQLLHAGVLQRQQALVLGDFSAYRLGPQDRGYDFATMLAYLRERLPLPVLTGLEFGHIARRVTLPVGAHAELVSDADGFRLSMSQYPTLPALAVNVPGLAAATP